MVAERKFIASKLKEAGIKAKVYTSMKCLKTCNEIQVGAILLDGETIKSANNRKVFVTEDGRYKRKRIFDRTIKMKVVIGEATAEKCEEIFEKFLLLIGKGIDDGNGNWSEIEVLEADWVDEADSILKSKMAVQIDLTVKNGIYKDVLLKGIDMNVSSEGGK